MKGIPHMLGCSGGQEWNKRICAAIWEHVADRPVKAQAIGPYGVWKRSDESSRLAVQSTGAPIHLPAHHRRLRGGRIYCQAATANPIALATKNPSTWGTSPSLNDLPNQRSISVVVRRA